MIRWWRERRAHREAKKYLAAVDAAFTRAPVVEYGSFVHHTSSMINR